MDSSSFKSDDFVFQQFQGDEEQDTFACLNDRLPQGKCFDSNAAGSVQLSTYHEHSQDSEKNKTVRSFDHQDFVSQHRLDIESNSLDRLKKFSSCEVNFDTEQEQLDSYKNSEKSPLYEGADKRHTNRSSPNEELGNQGRSQSVAFSSDSKASDQPASDNMSAPALNTDLFAKIEKENDLFCIHQHQVRRRWKETFSQDKLVSLREEASRMKSRYDLELKRKDDIITSLFHSCEHAENQSRDAFAAHLQKLRIMVQLFDSQLLTDEKEFQVKLLNMQRDYHMERDMIKQKGMGYLEQYTREIQKIELSGQSTVSEESRSFEQTLEEIKDQNMEEIKILRYTLESKIEDLKEHFQALHTEYLQSTEQQSEELSALIAKGCELSREVADRKSSIKTLKTSIRNLHKLSNAITERNSEVNSSSTIDETQQRKPSLFLSRKSEALANYGHNKQMILKSLSHHVKDMKHLALAAHKYKTRLSKRLSIINRILKLFDLFCSMGISPCLVQKYCTGQSPELTQSLIDCKVNPENMTNNLKKLTAFWERYNAATYDLSRLRSEQTELIRRKDELKDIIKKLNDGITVNDDVLQTSNPLFVVNGKMGDSCSTIRASSDRVRHTVIDGNHARLAFKRQPDENSSRIATYSVIHN